MNKELLIILKEIKKKAVTETRCVTLTKPNHNTIGLCASSDEHVSCRNCPLRVLPTEYAYTLLCELIPMVFKNE